MERLWQLRLSSRYRLPLFPTDVSQRLAVRRLARVASGRLVLFGLVHEHGHPVVFCTDEQIGLLKRSVRVSLRRVAAQPIDEVWAEPVSGRNHMRSLLRYVLEQPARHGLPDYPALWSGSCFLDLVGARHLPELSLRLGEALPSVRLSELHEMVGLPSRPVTAASDDLIRDLGARPLVEAVGAALALGPFFKGHAPRNIAARQLVVQLGRRAGLAWAEIQRVLPVSHATLFRLASAPPVDIALERAVRLRLGLEELVKEGTGARRHNLVAPHGDDREPRDRGVSPRALIPR